MTEEPITLEQLRERLAGFPIPDIRYFDVTGSTNDDALEWISNGALDGLPEKVHRWLSH
jgi:hypothetical protein